MRRIKIFDTTLRDGEQAPGCSMNLSEKIEVARQLETLGVDIIEAGFAVASQDDFKSVQEIARTVKNCTVASLSRATKNDIDRAYEAVKEAVNPRIHTFIATSPIHMQYKLKMTPDEVLERTRQMVAYAKSLCSDVEFSAEDATRSDRDFLVKVVYEAICAGATTVNIPDTVGFTTPNEMVELITYLKTHVPNIEQADISLHCHNDLGLAEANTLAGLLAGATQVECTVNGLGERAGNAALEEVVMALKTREKLFQMSCNIDTKHIYRTSKLIYNIIGQTAAINKAIVGSNAFLHESGIHQHGVLNEKSTYEIMTPESIGIYKGNLVLGKHSGKHAFEDKLKELGYQFSADEVQTFFTKFKEICDRKKSITDGDIHAIVASSAHIAGGFQLEGFDVHSGSVGKAVCVIRLRKDDQILEEVSLGDGPVDAAFNAIDKIINIQNSELEFYNINSATDGKDALGEVVVKLRIGERLINGRGVSTDIIEASILAYLNAVNKGD